MLSLIILIFFISKIKANEIRWALEIFTTGARSPNIPLKNNKDYFNHEWEDGSNELTGVGIRQHFLVGYRNRLRYIEDKKLINSNYDPREVYLVSTDTNCTLMSANAQVQGLFFPGTSNLLNKNQSDIALPPVYSKSYQDEKIKLDNDSYTPLPNKMNVIPIHSFFYNDHYMYLQDENICKGNSIYYKKNKERDEVTNYLENMKNKYNENLKKYYFNEKKDDELLQNYDFALNIFDNIISLYYEGAKELSDIAKNLNVDSKELVDDAFGFLNLTLIGNGIDNDKVIANYSMAPVFNQLLLWLNSKIEKDINNEKDYKGYDLPSFVMYSVDKDICGSFMAFLKYIFGAEINYPKFASNLYLELVRNNESETVKKEDYIIEYYFNDDYIMSIPFTEFETKIKNNLAKMEDVDIFCGFAKTEVEDTSKSYLAVDIVLGVISLILIILIFFTISKKIKVNQTNSKENSKI